MKKHSYIARVYRKLDIYWWSIIGINGKEVSRSKIYDKRSYALNRAKSFCDKSNGSCKLDAVKG